MKLLADADWIIEAVAENLEIKRGAAEESGSRAQARQPSSPPTPAACRWPASPQGFSDDFRRHWFGTHFFNPPRYMRLLEIIPTPETDPRRH